MPTFEQAERRVDNQIDRIRKEKTNKIRRYRQEVSRRASMANKRLDRLERAGMTDSPAYRQWAEQGGERFSIRGKDFNEVQSEMARVTAYLDSATSSITGAKNVLKELSKNTGLNIEWSNWTEAQQHTKNFFEIASQVEQYLRTVHDVGSAISYQEIWQNINQYVKEAEIDLSATAMDMEQISSQIVKAMDVWKEETTAQIWDVEGHGLAKSYRLPKNKR